VALTGLIHRQNDGLPARAATASPPATRLADINWAESTTFSLTEVPATAIATQRHLSGPGCSLSGRTVLQHWLAPSTIHCPDFDGSLARWTAAVFPRLLQISLPHAGRGLQVTLSTPTPLLRLATGSRPSSSPIQAATFGPVQTTTLQCFSRVCYIKGLVSNGLSPKVVMFRSLSYPGAITNL